MKKKEIIDRHIDYIKSGNYNGLDIPRVKFTPDNLQVVKKTLIDGGIEPDMIRACSEYLPVTSQLCIVSGMLPKKAEFKLRGMFDKVLTTIGIE